MAQTATWRRGSEKLSQAESALKRSSPLEQAKGSPKALEHLGDYLRMLRGSLQGLVASAPPRDFLESVLGLLEEKAGASGGIIYVLDDTEATLSCEAHVSAEHVEVTRPRNFSYRLDRDESFAVEVFRQEKILSDDASNRKWANPKGLDVFQIRGSIIGAPLVSDGVVVGVAVLWRNGRLEKNWLRAAEELLKADPLLAVAGAVIDLFQAEAKRMRVEAALARIAKNLAAPGVTAEHVRELLRSFKTLGFDRVRMFELTTDGFALRGALGDPELPASLVVPLTNPYVRNTLTKAKEQSGPIVYHPGEFGPDPDAERVGRPIDVQWLVLPLVSGGVLRGQLVADNAVSKRPIVRSHESMSVFSALAAQTLANTFEDEALNDDPEQIRPLVRLAVRESVAPLVNALTAFENTMKRAREIAAQMARNERS